MGGRFSLRRRDRGVVGKSQVKKNILSALVEAGSCSRSIVLLRELGGEQFLFDHEGAYTFEDDHRINLHETLPERVSSLCKEALMHDGAQTAEIEGRRYLVQTLCPKPRLFIVGAVHIAQTLAPMAHLAGYEVLLFDPRSAFASERRFPDVKIINDWPHEVIKKFSLDSRSALVTLSHDAKIDEPAIIEALNSDAFYIGALGSKKNHKKRLERLASEGFGETQLSRVHGPVGLFLGGRSPAEIAIAIIAQITQARYKTDK